MFIKDHAYLIYIAKSRSTNGSPVQTEIVKDCMVDLMDTFSNNYYFERGREMRDACNLIVNVHLTYDIVEDSVTYVLTYVTFRGVKYTIANILSRYLNSYKKDRFTRVLDLKKTL